MRCVALPRLHDSAVSESTFEKNPTQITTHGRRTHNIDER
jgi:hypothetical protein